MDKHILYLSYDGMTDPLGQSQVLPYIIGLTKEGYSFHLVSFEKPDRYLQNRTTIEAICKEHNIDWRPLKYTKRPPLLSTVWDVFKMKKVAIELHKKHSLSLIHCRSYISALIGLSFKRNYKVPFLFDMRGFWADERVDGGLWNLKNPIYKKVYQYFKRKEVQFFKESDHVVSLTSNGKKEILTWKGLGFLEEKISVIPCCVDTNKFNPALIDAQELDNLRQKLNIKSNQYVLGYVGSIGTWYMLDEMLTFFKRNTESKMNPLFLFISKEDPQFIINRAKSIGLDEKSILVTSAMHHEVPLFMSLFTCSIFFILPAYSKKASSPTKQGELMSMGIPLICNDGVGDTGDIVREYNAGCVVAENSIHDFIIEDIEFDRKNTMLGAKKYFGLDYGVATFLKVYNKIMIE